MPYKDKEKRKENRKKYREEHKEEIKLYQAQYCIDNKEKLAESKKKYYDKNKERLAKKAKLHYALNKEKFAQKYKKNSKSILAKQKEQRQKNPEKYNAISLKSRRKLIPQHRERNKQYIKEFLLANPCIKCDEDNPVCLCFHHTDPSQKNCAVSELVDRGSSIERMNKEISKCNILCMNCHHIEHWHDLCEDDIKNATKPKLKARKKKRLFAIEYRKEKGCSDCNIKDPRCLVFHHLNPEDKTDRISCLFSSSWEKLKTEIAKCKVLCQNCHCIEHA
tara:strand:+ start:6001 stop:6831 length:831 start_codon:yes stop_codon:yes gene_type:complete